MVSCPARREPGGVHRMSARTLRIRLIGTSALTLSAAACGAFGPERNPPQMASPGRYAAKEQSLEMPAADDDSAGQRLNAGARPVPEWWKEYGSDALDALVDEGLKNSPSLAAAESTLKAAREGLRAQIGQSLWPSVDVGFSPSRQRALAIPTLPEQTFLYNIFAAEVKTSYTFDFFGAAVLADRSLARQVQQQDYQLESVRRALAANIVVATINAAALQEQVTATEELVALGERRAQQTAARYALGSASLDDNLAAQEDAALAAATLPPLRAQAVSVPHAPAVLFGRTPGQAPPSFAFDALHLSDRVPGSLPADLLPQRP